VKIVRNIGKLIRKERKRQGMSQQQLANLIPGIERSTISRYENGADVPDDTLNSIIDAFKSPRLRLQVYGSAIPCLYLDNVDYHPVVVQQKAIEEMTEAIQELNNLMLINKQNNDDLTKKEKDRLLNNIMLELQDVNICMDLLLMVLSEKYDIDLNELERLSKNKMLKRGYMTSKMAVAR